MIYVLLNFIYHLHRYNYYHHFCYYYHLFSFVFILCVILSVFSLNLTWAVFQYYKQNEAGNYRHHVDKYPWEVVYSEILYPADKHNILKTDNCGITSGSKTFTVNLLKQYWYLNKDIIVLQGRDKDFLKYFSLGLQVDQSVFNFKDW